MFVSQKKNILIVKKNGILDELNHPMKRTEENVKKCWKK